MLCSCIRLRLLSDTCSCITTRLRRHAAVRNLLTDLTNIYITRGLLRCMAEWNLIIDVIHLYNIWSVALHNCITLTGVIQLCLILYSLTTSCLEHMCLSQCVCVCVCVCAVAPQWLNCLQTSLHYTWLWCFVRSVYMHTALCKGYVLYCTHASELCAFTHMHHIK